jgi:hypothetical protein
MLRVLRFSEHHQLTNARFIERAMEQLPADAATPPLTQLAVAAECDPIQGHMPAMLEDLRQGCDLLRSHARGIPCLPTPINRWSGGCLAREFHRHAVPIPDTRCVLIRLPPQVLPLSTWDMLFHLQGMGLRPLILQPERCPALPPRELASFLAAGGVLLLDLAALAIGTRHSPARDLIATHRSGLRVAAFGEAPQLFAGWPPSPPADIQALILDQFASLDPAAQQAGGYRRSTTRIFARRRTTDEAKPVASRAAPPALVPSADGGELHDLVAHRLQTALALSASERDPPQLERLCRWAIAFLESEARSVTTPLSVQIRICLTCICLLRDLGLIAEAINTLAWFLCSRSSPCWRPGFNAEGGEETAVALCWLIDHLRLLELPSVADALHERFARRLTLAHERFALASPVGGFLDVDPQGGELRYHPHATAAMAPVDPDQRRLLRTSFLPGGKYSRLLAESSDDPDDDLCMLYDPLD